MGPVNSLNPVGSNHPTILFDGVCNLCNSSVQFVIKRDPKARFRFAALQSDFGVAFQKEHGLDSGMLTSVVLFYKEKVFRKSDAALEIAWLLPGLWPAFYVLKIFPRFLRDWVYNIVARNRYKWWGERTECMIPTKELKARFI